MKFLSPSDIKIQLDSGNAVLLDIREPYEYEICSIGGIQIPMAHVMERVQDLNKEALTVVMCRSGKRAEAVANLLESECGFTNLVVMDGGLLAWIEEVDPTLEIE